jgi:Bacterial dnaA protein helix-turn-helix
MVPVLQAEQTEKKNKTSTEMAEYRGWRRLPHGGPRHDEVREICEGVQDILSACFSVPGRDIRALERCRTEISRIRQIGMYVAHVIAGLTMYEVGIGFQRDRTTVAHACHVVEDLRDEPEFEHVIHMVERIVEIAFVRSDRR